jgi:hypothetical protein
LWLCLMYLPIRAPVDMCHYSWGLAGSILGFDGAGHPSLPPPSGIRIMQTPMNLLMSCRVVRQSEVSGYGVSSQS